MRSPSDIPLANEVPTNNDPEQPGPAGEGNRVELFLGNSGTLQGCIDDRDYVLLMGARGEFGNNAAIFGDGRSARQMTLLRRRPSARTAAEVSSHDDSIPRIIFLLSFIFAAKVSDFFLIRIFP